MLDISTTGKNIENCCEQLKALLNQNNLKNVISTEISSSL